MGAPREDGSCLLRCCSRGHSSAASHASARLRSSVTICRNLLAGAAASRQDRRVPVPVQPPYDLLLAAAETVAAARPDVDLEMAREVFAEAATLLHDGLVLDHLDEHDAHAVVGGLSVDLITADPGAAIRERAQAALEAPGDLHDPQEVWASYLTTVGLFQLWPPGSAVAPGSSDRPLGKASLLKACPRGATGGRSEHPLT